VSTLLITGASGNIGTALLRRLADEPDLEIIGVARRPPPPQPPYDRVAWHAVDISDDASVPALRKILAGVDTVVHLVWAFQPTRDPQFLEEVGVGGSARVLAAADEAGVAHLVHMSSVGAYAPKTSDEPVTESYPHTSMPSSLYSTHKAAAERNLDDYERDHPGGMTITRVRPGIVVQHDAGAALSRYGLPGYLPVRLLRAVPLLPLDRRFAVPVVHSDDVADAVARIVQRRAGGAFNVAADQPLTRTDIAAVLHARAFHVPAPVLRSVVSLSWRLNLQPLSPGWIDLAFAVPLQDSQRAHTELGWHASVEPRAALEAAISGITANAGTASPSLRPRSAFERIRTLVTAGPVSRRKQP
jgi:UDP-glucose 4-epimerase